MPRKVFSKKSIDFKRVRRPRNVQNNPPVQPEPVPESISAFQDVEEVRDKASTLREEIHRVSITQSIPVPQDNLPLVNAVRRQDGGSDGKFVSFDLYLRAYASKQAPRELKTDEIRTKIDFLARQPEKKLSEAILSTRADLTPDLAQFVQSQASYLYILQMMQGGLQALETSKQTATKLPNGSEGPATLSSIALSIAFLAEYTDNTIDAIKRMFQEFSQGSSDIEAAAKLAEGETFKDFPLAKAVIQSKAPSDFDLIYDFSLRFLTSTRKAGYEGWIVYPDVLSIEKDLSYDLSQKDRYIVGKPEVDPAVFKMSSFRAKSHAKTLDYIATSLGERELPIDVFCSVQWLLKLAEPVILLLRSTYQLLMTVKGLELYNLSKVEVSSQGFLFDILHDALSLFSQVAKKLLCWFQRDNEVWGILEACPPIYELVNAAVTALEELQGWVFMHMDEAINDLLHKERAIVLKTQFLMEMRKLRLMLHKLEFVSTASVDIAKNVIKLSESTIDASAFGDLAESMKLDFKEKPKRLKDFVKREFTKSKFLSKGPQGILRAPFDLPDIPFQNCNFSPPQAPIFTSTIERLERIPENTATRVDQAFADITSRFDTDLNDRNQNVNLPGADGQVSRANLEGDL